MYTLIILIFLLSNPLCIVCTVKRQKVAVIQKIIYNLFLLSFHTLALFTVGEVKYEPRLG